MSSREVNCLKNYFKLKCLHVSDYWLECCLDWFKQQHSATYTDDYMCTEVMRQWLQTDIRDIEIGSLPNNLTKHKKYILNGNYAVQIMYIKDISKSSYSQLKTIRDMYKLTRAVAENDDNDYFTTNGTGKRVLYLNMTDGLQVINGFEYETVNSLSLNMKPGVKIMLKGPLQIRNGEFLLKSNNVQVLGGEVEDLLVCNSVENILARELNMPENPNAGKSVIESTENNPSENNVQNDVPNLNTNAQFFGDFDDTRDEDEMILANLDSLDLDQANVQPQNTINNKLPSFNDLDENNDIFADIDVTAELRSDITSNVNDEQSSGFHDLDIDLKQLEEIENRANNPTISTSHHPADNIDFDDEIELMERMEAELQNENKQLQTNKPNTHIIKREPIICLKYLSENRDKLSNSEIYKVKARFVRATQKLNLNKRVGWFMKFEIKDSTGLLEVDFLSTVIERLMDLSPKEALAENKKVKTKVSQSHERVSEALKNCKRKLESVQEYLMHLQFKEGSQVPTIVCLETVHI